MTALTDFLPLVLPEVDGCPSPVAVNAVRNACRAFCQTSRYWQEDLTAFASVAGQELYPLTPPTNTNICAVIQNDVTFDGGVVYESGDTVPKRCIAVTSSSPSRYYIVNHGGSLNLRPYPIVNQSLADAFVVTVALKPSNTAAEVDDRVYIDHLETIAAGALERLFNMEGQKWTNKKAAMGKGFDFTRGVSEARIAVSKGYSNQSLTTQHKPLA